MDNLPEKITRIDVVRVERGVEKQCRCRNSSYIIDTQNRLVYCDKCGGIVDAFEAIKDIATYYERLGDQVDSLLDERKQILEYQPRRIAVRELLKKYEHELNKHNNRMLPLCPKCREPIEPGELTHWVNAGYYARMYE